MTQASEPDDRRLDRTLRSLDRRISRLEDTQVTWRELNESFDRVYEEIDALEAQIDRRFDNMEASVNQRFDRVDDQFRSLNEKFDIIMRRLTGEGNNPIT